MDLALKRQHWSRWKTAKIIFAECVVVLLSSIHGLIATFYILIQWQVMRSAWLWQDCKPNSDARLPDSVANFCAVCSMCTNTQEPPSNIHSWALMHIDNHGMSLLHVRSWHKAFQRNRNTACQAHAVISKSNEVAYIAGERWLLRLLHSDVLLAIPSRYKRLSNTSRRDVSLWHLDTFELETSLYLCSRQHTILHLSDQASQHIKPTVEFLKAM